MPAEASQPGQLFLYHSDLHLMASCLCVCVGGGGGGGGGEGEGGGTWLIL